MPNAHTPGALRASAAVFLLAPALTVAQAPPPPLTGLDGYIEQTMRDWGIPGASIAVVKADSVIWARGFGIRRLGDTARVDARTVFAIGSISKSFTAAALGMLVDEGRIGWDDLVVDRLRGFRLADRAVTHQVTIRDLLSHRTGMPGPNLLFWGNSFSREEVLQRLRFIPLHWGLRSHFAYQNHTVVAAGQVVPAVTGMSWDDFVHQRIFAPLGMTSSATSAKELSRWSNVASPHQLVDGRLQPIPWTDLDNAGPAASITSTALDVAQYVRMQLGKGSYLGKRLLSERTVDEMHSPQMVIPRESQYVALFPDAHFMLYGLGWITHDYHGYRVVEHGGQTDGMHATLTMIPALDLGLVVLTNTVLFGYPAAIGYRVFDQFLGRPARDWSAEMRERLRQVNEGGAPRLSRVADAAATIPADRLVGRYRHQLYGDAVVELRDGRLTLSTLGRAAPLEHWHYDSYRPSWSDGFARGVLALATFERDGRGEVRALRFDSVGDFERVRENR